MEYNEVRAVIGDMKGEYIRDEHIKPFLNSKNVFIAAADAIETYLGTQLFAGAGVNVRTDDLSVNQYNNLVLLRDHARGLRERGNKLADEEASSLDVVGIYWPEGNHVYDRRI